MCNHVCYALALGGAALVCAAAGGSARAAIVNGDFETGDLTGWVFTSNAPTVAVTNVGGDFQAEIDFPISVGIGELGELQQTFSIAEDGWLSFDYSAFINVHRQGLAGTFGFQIYNADTFENVAHAGASRAAPGTATIPESTLRLRIPAPGNYLFTAGVYGDRPSLIPAEDWSETRLTLDNVSFSTVPEPATWLLAGLAAAGVWGMRRRG